MASSVKNDTHGIPNLACYEATFDVTNNIWMSDNILENRAPLLAIQIAYNVIISRILHSLLRPLHIPLFVVQILTGFTLSGSFLGRYPVIFRSLYRENGILAVENYANMGIMYCVFLNGLEMNCDTLLRSSKKALIIAIAGIVTPMLLGACFLSLLHMCVNVKEPPSRGGVFSQAYLFWCLVASVTGFPVLARLLSELKILYTRLGKDALNAAILIDAYGWILLTLIIPFSTAGGNHLLSLFSTLLFIGFCFCVLRPILIPMIERRTRMEKWTNSKLLDVMAGVFICSYITDFLGTHHSVGAFVYGLILPTGKFADLMMVLLYDFATGIMAAVYFSGFGFRVNIELFLRDIHWPYLVLIIFLLASSKVLSSMIASFFFGMPIRDGLGIGLLLNTKGYMAVLLLNIAWNRTLVSPFTYTVSLIAVLTMTMLVSPLISVIYKPKFRFMQSQLRTVQKLRFGAEFRVVVCVHNSRQATGMIHVLEATNPSRMQPLHVSVLHLVELTRHGTALLVAQMENPTAAAATAAENHYGSQLEFDGIAKEFEHFINMYGAARFETAAVVSTYETIHEDIYNVTEEKRACLILLPFHKELTSDGSLEATIDAANSINENVLHQPPCSIGIFLNRGLCSLSQTNMRIVMVFIGGPDDREALSIAWRMAGHPGTHLNVVRLLVIGETASEQEESFHSDANGLLSTVMDNVMQKELDEEYIINFRHKGVHNNESIVYTEKEAEIATGEEIPMILNEIDKPGYDLYIVGQGSGKNYPSFSKLFAWCDNPELGVIGDIVASTSFGTHSSLLVVQQYMVGKKQRKPPRSCCHARKKKDADSIL
ncbi:hypothetical protein RJT34_24210 [Clitoria ternatea]|uniref:Cation/H+ exchanger domain-containing protein n=1 Tax=Clitoria ternatea TaxID=43366 RepID=A0AAN9FMM6_CLITE